MEELEKQVEELETKLEKLNNENDALAAENAKMKKDLEATRNAFNYVSDERDRMKTTIEIIKKVVDIAKV